MIPAWPSTMCSFNWGNIEWTSSSKIVLAVCVYPCMFYVCLVKGFIYERFWLSLIVLRWPCVVDRRLKSSYWLLFNHEPPSWKTRILMLPVFVCLFVDCSFDSLPADRNICGQWPMYLFSAMQFSCHFPGIQTWMGKKGHESGTEVLGMLSFLLLYIFL